MLRWFRKPKTLADALFQPTTVKIHGIIFKVRKLNPLDYLSGAKALQSFFQTYEQANQSERIELLEKKQKDLKEHYIDVIMAGVLEPKMSRKEGEPGAIWVENLFTDWNLANELYVSIVNNTYGKKKATKPSK